MSLRHSILFVYLLIVFHLATKFWSQFFFRLQNFHTTCFYSNCSVYFVSILSHIISCVGFLLIVVRAMLSLYIQIHICFDCSSNIFFISSFVFFVVFMRFVCLRFVDACSSNETDERKRIQKKKIMKADSKCFSYIDMSSHVLVCSIINV